MDKLIFPITLKQKLASVVTQIISIDELCKELNLVYNLNIDNLKVYV